MLDLLDADALRLELLRIRPLIANAESERVTLARRVVSLTAERDNYLQGLTNTKRSAAAASQLHDQQRKEDTQLFQENLKRLLSEKATLHEEVEMMSSQKDALTEALVKANHQLSDAQRIIEELKLFKTQHAEAAERLQVGLAARDTAARELHAMRLERDQLKEQLIAARLAVTQRKGDAERLRADWESARSTGEETRASLIRAESRNRRLDSSITSLSSELRALESEHASSASSSGDTIRRLRMELATCTSALSEGDAQLQRAHSTLSKETAAAQSRCRRTRLLVRMRCSSSRRRRAD